MMDLDQLLVLVLFFLMYLFNKVLGFFYYSWKP